MERPTSITTRGTQTILTSRGLITFTVDDASAGTSVESATVSRNLNESVIRLSQGTQATPPLSARYQTSREPSGEILRIATSFTSANSAGPAGRNETITLTTDYAVRNFPEVHSDSPPPTIFYDPSRRHGVYRPNPWLPCCCTKFVDLDDEDRRAPPAYSLIFPPALREPHPAVLMSNHTSSFVARPPPPSYAQAQGICIAFSLEQLISSSTSDGRMWSPRSTTAVCPRCATLVFTMVEMHQAPMSHVAALILFLIGCWPCCLLPYCIDTCKKSHHYCPFCRTYLGSYTP